MASRKLMWFDNPPKQRKRRSPAKRQKSRRRPPKGFQSWQSWSRSMRAKIGKKGNPMARKRRTSHKRRSTRRRSHRQRPARAATITLRNPRRHHRVRRFRHRSNPRFSVGGIMARVKNGAIDGLFIVGGKAVTNAIPSLIGLAPTGALGIGIKALSAVAAGFLFGFVSPNAAKLATAAGFAAIYEPFIKGLGIPLLSNALADDDLLYGAYPDEVSSGSMSAWPESMGEADYVQQY